jgi:hypothetical protein
MSVCFFIWRIAHLKGTPLIFCPQANVQLSAEPSSSATATAADAIVSDKVLGEDE